MPDSLFAHRLNEDETYDSICRTCFAAVVRSKPESELATYESAHECAETGSPTEARFLPLRHKP